MMLFSTSAPETIPSPAHRSIGVHVQPGRVVTVDHVAADRRAVAAVAMVDPMLQYGTVRLVVLNQQIVAEVGENPPTAVVGKGAVADGDMVAGVDPHPGARSVAH